MLVASCPLCGESARLPLDDLPRDSSVQCPWCGEVSSAQSWLRGLPPMVRVLDHEGNPLAPEDLGVKTNSPPSLAVAAHGNAEDVDTATEGAVADENAEHGSSETVNEADVEGDDDDEANLHLAEPPATELESEREQVPESTPASVVIAEEEATIDSDHGLDLQIPEMDAAFAGTESQAAAGWDEQIETDLGPSEESFTEKDAFESPIVEPDLNEPEYSEPESQPEMPQEEPQKKVPIATDQRNYYDRHEWGRRRKFDLARTLKLALPTLLVLPLVAGAVAFSGVDLGFYPFDASLKLSSSEPAPSSESNADVDDMALGEAGGDADKDQDDNSELDSGANAPTTAPQQPMTARSRTDVASGLQDSIPEQETIPEQEKTDPADHESTIPAAPAAIEPSPAALANEEREAVQEQTEETDTGVQPEETGVADSSMPLQPSVGDVAESDSNELPSITFLDELIERLDGESSNAENATAGDATDSSDISPAIAGTPPTQPAISLPDEFPGEDQVAGSNDPSNDVPAVASVDHQSEVKTADHMEAMKVDVQPETAEEMEKRNRDMNNALLIFPLEAPPKSDKSGSDVAESGDMSDAIELPLPEQALPSEDNETEELKLAVNEASTALSGLTVGSPGRDQAIGYRAIARLGAMTFDVGSPSVSRVLNEMAGSDALTLFKGLEATWARSKRRDTDGILLIGRLRSNGDQELWYETSGGDYLDVTTEGDVPRDVRSVAIGRIVEVEPKIRIELVAGTALPEPKR
ncbi:MAG: hypothetical protein AAFX06_20960 [Planctomycetota bacterium]